MKRYPLLLSPVTKTALWGGSRLRDEYGKQSPHARISEAWELTVREGDENTVLNGEAEGMTLSAYLAAVGTSAVSSDYTGGHFPLLIKLIDAADRLSVQVHPDDAYAHAHGIDSGKTEMWYVVDAAPGATLIAGLRDGASAEDFREAAVSGRLDTVMRAVPVKAGDVFFIPAGLLHAIGEGILIAEIQQSSDTTYRVWDYERVGADGKKRELHVAQALEVVRPISASEIEAERYSVEPLKIGEPIAACPLFRVSRLSVEGAASFAVTEDSFLALTVISGSGTLSAAGETLSLKRGDTVFLPAALGEVSLSGRLDALLSAP